VTLLDASQTSPIQGGASFSLGNRMLRVAWGVAWILLARWTPPPLHFWRRLVLKAFGATIAPTARVHASVSVWLPSNLQLDEHVLVGPRARLYNQGKISIGAKTIVSQGAYICASSHDIRDPNFQLVLRPVVIGRQCWIAADAFVGPGVTMKDHSVVAARGALFNDAEPDGVYRGNPAELIKYRNLRNAD